jgi:hypothetical protein
VEVGSDVGTLRDLHPVFLRWIVLPPTVELHRRIVAGAEPDCKSEA